MGQLPSDILAALAGLTGTAAKPALLRVEFPQEDGTPSVAVEADTAGVRIAPSKAASEPLLFLAQSVVASAPAGQKYVMLSVDPDGPFPTWPVLAPILHGFRGDLVAAPSADAPAGWVPLTSAAAPLVGFGKPGLPPPSAAHRYIFIVWKQAEGYNGAALQTQHGWTPPVGLWPRIRLDVAALQKTLGVDEIVAINYFTSQHRD